jgi:hypothetical protein
MIRVALDEQVARYYQMRREDDTFEATFAERNKRRFKPQDIGIFDLQFPNPKDLGVVIDNSRLVYTNVNSFAERIKTFIEIQANKQEVIKKIIECFPTFFAGSAII